VGRKTCVFYCPVGFEATWEEFKRILKDEGKTMSQELRIWIEGYVKRKDPTNPQRPLTAWSPENEDHHTPQEEELYTFLYTYADKRGGELTYKLIVNYLQGSGVHYTARSALADELAKRLSKAGIRVVR